jgi:hypothetical protein
MRFRSINPAPPEMFRRNPDFDFIVVSVDTALTEKEENDPTGCTTWGRLDRSHRV